MRAALVTVCCTLLVVVHSTELSPCARHSDCSPSERCFLARGELDNSIQGICTGKSIDTLASPVSASSFIEVEESRKTEEKGNVAGNGELRLAAPKGKSSTVRLGREPKRSYSVGVDGEGEFFVREGEEANPYLSVKDDVVQMNTKVLHAKNVNAKDGFKVGPVLQWGMAVSDTFSTQDKGKANSTRQWQADDASMEMNVQACGGVTMLGGPGAFSTGEVSKTYTGLRPHTAVRVVATVHLIDLWMGEFVYMKLSTGAVNAQGIPESEYVWTKSYSAASSTSAKASGVNICGDEQVVEMEFSVPIDVSARHTKDSLKITFGSKLGKSADTSLGGASWGISRVDLFLKSQE